MWKEIPGGLRHILKITKFSTDEELAVTAASAWLDEITTNRAGKLHCVALSGGRITLKFLASVIEQAHTRKSSFSNVHFFWADERCVPPTDPESNFAAADKHFFQPLSIRAGNIHRIRGEESPERAAQLATEDIIHITPRTADQQPMLDLIFLGMGEDGHVASLFPHEPESAMADQSVYRAIGNSPKPPPNRVTLGYRAIAAARKVWVLASGAGKETALRESLKPEGQTPLARVLRSSKATVFTDIPTT
jgi:6-phosphogluconolactonase